VNNVHLLLEGHVSDTQEGRSAPSGDYHEYFEINNIPQEVAWTVRPVQSHQRATEDGRIEALLRRTRGQRNFSRCQQLLSTTTSYLELESYGGQHASAVTHTPSGCKAVTASPSGDATVTPDSSESKYDEPDGAVTELTVPRKKRPANQTPPTSMMLTSRCPKG